MVKIILKKNKGGNLHYRISRLIIKLNYVRLYSTGGARTDKHRWNKIAQKQTQTFIDTIYATKWALQNNDDRVVFLINESE